MQAQKAYGYPRDPLDLARVADRIGDGLIAEVLGKPGEPISLNEIHHLFLALRLVPWMDAPEVVIPRLTELACSKDPDLAFAATKALITVARSVDARVLDDREIDLKVFEEGVERIQKGCRQGEARPDIAQALGEVKWILGDVIGRNSLQGDGSAAN
ncbi:MAG: hypothetical protein NZM37_11320 [Sandaracinaceae bacterium]|nr:hypothetical protein [Sandaracinaceae bacterium]